MENKEIIGVTQKEVEPVQPDQSLTIGKLALALSKAQGSMSGAVKDSKNPFFKSSYADLYSCIEASREALSKNELAVIQTTESEGKSVTVITTLVHSSGEWIRGRISMVPKKDDDQARGSSITYGRRYAFAAIVGLAQKDDDGNGATEQPKKTNKPQKQAALKPVETITSYIDKFLEKDKETKANIHKADALEIGWNAHVYPILKQYSEAEQNKITAAYNDTLEILKEDEAVK